MDTLFKDLTYAARGLRKNLGFALVSTLTIALGIGACTGDLQRRQRGAAAAAAICQRAAARGDLGRAPRAQRQRLAVLRRRTFAISSSSPRTPSRRSPG